MVVALGPGKFYGSSLPRPRFYTDVKLNEERIDPPPSVMDPLMAWAQEAHWSMGGLSFKRHRLQGRIEGNIQRLRAQRETIFKKSHKSSSLKRSSTASRPHKDQIRSEISKSPSPPPAPMAIKRRRVIGLLDEEEEAEEALPAKRGPVRKLGDDFEKVARESGMAEKRGKRVEAELGVGEGSNSNGKRGLVKGGRRIGAAVVAAAVRNRSSPRLTKSGGSR